MDLIAARLYIHKEELYDLCEFNQEWTESSHFNAFTADWPTNRICFMNPPFSQTSPAIYKAMLEFCKGKNVVLLVKYTSAVEAAKFKYECLFKLASVENTPKPVAFVYIDNKKGTVLDQPLVLIYLLQPEVWQHIMLMDS